MFHGTHGGFLISKNEKFISTDRLEVLNWRKFEPITYNLKQFFFNVFLSLCLRMILQYFMSFDDECIIWKH